MRLEFNGLKAADRSVELGKLNLFRGPVGSGKSSCLDALRFLALGYVPQNGKLPELTGRLMRGTEIGARLSLDGRTLERRLICEQVKGVTRYRAEAIDSAHSPKAKATEHSERIRGLFGSSDAEAAENLDLRALLSLSGNERAKKVQALLANTSGMSVDEIMSIVGPLAVCRVAEYPEAKLPTDATALAGLAAGFLHALDAGKKAALHAATEQVRQWLGEMTLPDSCERANMAKGEAARALAEKKAARTELENRKMQLGDVADSEVALSSRRDAAIQRRGSLQGEIDRAISTRSARTNAEAPIPALVALVEELTATHAAALDRLGEIVALEAQVAAIVDPPAVANWTPVPAAATPEADALDAEAAAIVDPPAPPAPKVHFIDAGQSSRASALDQEAATLTAEADAIRLGDLRPIAAEESALKAAETAHAKALENPWREVVKHADDIDAKLGQAGTWSLEVKIETDCLRELARHHGGDVEALKAAVESAATALELAKEQSAKSAAAIQGARQKREELREAARLKREEASAIRIAAEQAAKAANAQEATVHAQAVEAWKAECRKSAEARKAKTDAAKALRRNAVEYVALQNEALKKAYDDAVSVRHVAVTANEREKFRLTKQIEAIRADARGAQEKLDRARADLAEAKAKLEGIATVTTDIDAAQADLAIVEGEIKTVDAALELVKSTNALREEMATLVGKIEAAAANQVAYAALEWALGRLRAEDVRRRSGGLVAHMDTFLAAAGRTETAYIRVDRGVCEFGWKRGSDEIALEALSGGEGVIFSAALASAVIVSRDVPIKALLIEGAELGSGDPALAIMRGAAAMPLDLVMVATNATVEPVAGFVLHEIGVVEAVA